MPLESKTVQNFQGVFANFQILSQPKGAVSRDSNLWFALRGALRTMPGSKIICAPGNAAPNAVWRAIQTFFPSIASSYRVLALSLSGSEADLYDVTGSTWNAPALLTIIGSPMTKRPAVLGGTPQPTPSLIPYADKMIVTTSDSVPPYMYDGSVAPPSPALSTSASGALAATTYFVRITYVGYATPSIEVSIAVPANHVLVVHSPPPPPSPLIATAYDVWVGLTSGSETKQNKTPVNIGTNWTEPNGGLIGGGAMIAAGSPGGHALLNNFNSNAKYGKWKPNHNFKQNHIVAIIVDNIQFEYSATQSGKSGDGSGTAGNPDGHDNADQFPTTVNATIVDGDTGWKCLGPLPSPPPGAAYAFSHLGFLFLWGVSAAYLADGISGPDSVWQSGLNDPQYWDPAFTGFVGKGSGETAQGGAVLTLGETGIAATQQLVLFKDASTYSVFGDFSTSIEILQAKAGVGCVAPGTVQFMADLGILRLSYKGMTLFDGQNDVTEIYTDPIRSYIFGETDPTTGEQLIPPLDFENIQVARSTQVKNPSCYAMIAPVKLPTPPPPPTTPIGFVSSGELVPISPPAPSIISAPSSGFVFTGTAGPFGGGTLPLTLTLNIPAGRLPGDLLVAIITVAGIFPGAGASLTPITLPSGWTSYTYFEDTITVNVLYRIVDGTEGSTQDFVYPGPTSNFAGYVMEGTIIPIRDADPVTPFDVFAESGGFASGSVTATGVVTTVQNDLILIFMAPNFGFLSPGNVPGTAVQVNTNQQGTGGSATLSGTLALWSKAFAGPGATGGFTSPSGWGSSQVQRLVLAVKPSSEPFGEIEGFPETANGVIVPSPIIKGAATSLVSPQGMVTDARGDLWIADSDSNTNGAILFYSNPTGETGNTVPDRVIAGPSHTLLAQPVDVAVDGNSFAYVANYSEAGTGQILIFGAGASGDAAPSAEIGGGTTGLLHPRSVAVDATGNVYVLDDTVNKIYVWHAGNTGNVAPDQTITGAATLIVNPLQVRISPDGRLWVTCGKLGATPATILAFNLTDNGNVAPQRQLVSAALQPSSGNGGPTGLCFDANSNLYVAMSPNNEVIVFQAGVVGNVNPIQTITGFVATVGIAGFVMIPPLPTGVGASRLFVYDLESQVWAIGDLPWPIGAAAFLPTLSDEESVVGHISDGTIRRIFNPADLDWDGTEIVGTVRLPEFGRSTQPLYVRRMNFRAEGSGRITSVTARYKNLQGQFVARPLLAPKLLTGSVDFQTKVLSVHLDVGFAGQIVIEGVEYQIAEKKPTRAGYK